MTLEEKLRESSESPYVSKFIEFFEGNYKRDIEKLVENYPDKRSLEIDFKLLEQFDIELADAILDSPDILIEAAHDAVEQIEIPSLELDHFSPHVRFFNLPKAHEPLVRDISARHLEKLLAVEGVVREITTVMPKLKVAVWKCKHCGNTYKKEQDDNTLKMPSFCECRHRDFDLVPDQSEFIDSQRIRIQEPLEKLKGNEQPSTLDVFVSDDIVNRIAAGDTTRFVGVLRLNPPDKKKTVYGRYLEAMHLEETQREFEEVEITSEEEEEIKKLSARSDIYDRLTKSIAPAIYGHETVKESIIMQLFGGVKKHFPGGQVIRGNVHVLLVGDPGTGKSQILQHANIIAPKSIYTAGKTTSGVGLTASAVKDDFGEGGWTLKAGALVLSSGGICMVDEFDKMDTEDRSAMHEAMEQGTISVAKAGIVTRFKSDTSILAAANPKMSRFDRHVPFIQQINLPASLISRFDLFFMIRDVLDKTKDEAIAAHILKNHRTGERRSQYKKKGKAFTAEEELENEISTPPINSDLLGKYLSYARQKVFPILCDDAQKVLHDFYIGLRDIGRNEDSYAATHRQLEGLVRLSEASARVRLSDTVEKEDAERAVRLVRESLGDLVTDPETGKIDYDIIMTGQTHTQVTNMRQILSIVRDKVKEGQDMVPLQDVLNQAEGLGIETDKAKDMISKLEKNGELYRPRHNFLKPTQKG